MYDIATNVLLLSHVSVKQGVLKYVWSSCLQQKLQEWVSDKIFVKAES